MNLFPRNSFDVIAIGDATLDIFLELKRAQIACELKQRDCKIIFDFGAKLPVERVTHIPGCGNASNAAIAARRLGLKTTLLSIIGDDAVGEQTMRRWKQERVNTSLIQIDRHTSTNSSTVLSFQGERTIFVYHHKRHYQLPRLPITRWLYYTSLGKGHERFERDLIAHLDHYSNIQLCFNPGTYQLARGKKGLSPIIKRSTILSLNREEAEMLLEKKDASVSALIQGLHRLGSRIVLLTDGERGSYASDGAQIWHLKIFQGKALERTGAGDSYTAAFMSAIAMRHTIPEAMRMGTANAWSVIQHVGPQTGLLTPTEMGRVLMRFRQVQPKLI